MRDGESPSGKRISQPLDWAIGPSAEHLRSIARKKADQARLALEEVDGEIRRSQTTLARLKARPAEARAAYDWAGAVEKAERRLEALLKRRDELMQGDPPPPE